MLNIEILEPIIQPVVIPIKKPIPEKWIIKKPKVNPTPKGNFFKFTIQTLLSIKNAMKKIKNNKKSF